ncbi:thermonuclease family protein [Taylorella equigenitalis]|nr:putative nuclease [Taylorella equigenitalis ATCC 35865]ASY30454.1 nuclease [Taylorella equigenitalis]ASY37761.1 nuclease [Taylorella equigenitalis]ASY39229.1 nuclease [Taylorella equigenitalis]ASY40747.1 nuclease [Taylorella equigenitalis]
MFMQKILWIFLFFTPFVAQAETIVCNVVGVFDGDTFKCLTKNKVEEVIRLKGIDAPEKKQPFGNKAKKQLSDLIFGKDVLVNYSEEDIYKRLVGDVLFEGRLINQDMVASGYAWVFRKYNRDKKYLEIEAEARKNHLGIWSQKNPTYPSKFRRSTRKY